MKQVNLKMRPEVAFTLVFFDKDGECCGETRVQSKGFVPEPIPLTRWQRFAAAVRNFFRRFWK